MTDDAAAAALLSLLLATADTVAGSGPKVDALAGLLERPIGSQQNVAIAVRRGHTDCDGQQLCNTWKIMCLYVCVCMCSKNFIFMRSV